MTYSIIVLDKKTDLMGIGVVSGSIAVGSRVPWARYRVGGVATQAFTNPSLGPIILDLLGKGHDPEEALTKALMSDNQRMLRQVAVMDWRGRTAYHNGSNVPGEHGAYVYRECVSIANLVVSKDIPEILCRTYYEYQGDPVDALLKALWEAHRLGGDRRGDHSSVLLVVGWTPHHPYYDRIIDLRIDYSRDPINQLINLYNIYRRTMMRIPQMR